MLRNSPPTIPRIGILLADGNTLRPNFLQLLKRGWRLGFPALAVISWHCSNSDGCKVTSLHGKYVLQRRLSLSANIIPLNSWEHDSRITGQGQQSHHFIDSKVQAGSQRKTIKLIMMLLKIIKSYVYYIIYMHSAKILQVSMLAKEIGILKLVMPSIWPNAI